MNGKLTNPQTIKQFILAGNALFTIENANTGNCYTYKVQAGKNGSQTRFVRVLIGAESTDASNYAYLGLIDGGVFRRTKATHISPDAQSFKAFNWLWGMVSKGKPLPAQVEFWHAGHCGRCGRLLTVPASIGNGIGPECARIMETQHA